MYNLHIFNTIRLLYNCYLTLLGVGGRGLCVGEAELTHEMRAENKCSVAEFGYAE